MAKVTITNDNATFEVPDGSRLLDYAKANSSMPFGCGAGSCGVCICSVVKGAENLNLKTQVEEQTLTRMNVYPSQRLACQIVVKKGEVVVEY